MAKKALIDPNCIISDWDGNEGQRICEVVEVGSEFSVASPLFWIDCADDVSPADHFYVNDVITVMAQKPEEEPVT